MSKAASRRRRLLLWVVAITAVGHMAATLALGVVLSGASLLTAAGGLWIVVTWRLVALRHDRIRPRWVTRLVDEPLFVHWGGSLLGTAALLVALPLVWALSADIHVAALQGYALGGAVCAWGVWGRRRIVRVVRHEVPVRGLPPELDGYRIVHLSDLHIGSFDRKERGLSWARLANGCEPDLVAVTGDLVTSGTAFYGDVAEVLGELRSRDGVFACLGNHDQWDDVSLGRLLEAQGIAVLRNDAQVVRRGTVELLVAGLDDPYTGKDDIRRALASATPGRPTVLLSHYPRLFEQAAALGADLVLSGHTHGGQFAVPLCPDRWNIARATGQHGRGLFRVGHSTLHVTAGLGTTGPPMRIGVAPEVGVLVLRRMDPR